MCKLINWNFSTHFFYQTVITDLNEQALSGVPQWSALGLLLFLIWMIDSDHEIRDANLGSFADDTRIWQSLVNAIHTAQHPQFVLDTTYHWAEENNMIFSSDKFEMLSFGKIYWRSQCVTPQGEPIESKESNRDLGGIFQINVNYDKHIINIVAESNHISWWVLQIVKNCSKNIKLTLLKTLVLSQVGYGCIIWMPTSQTHIY